MPQSYGEMIIHALYFAACKHRKQRRKDQEKTPYINHCIHVLRLITDVGQVQDDAILAASVLHDVLEDTQTTVEELHDAFGDQITRYVQEVSDDKTLPKAERKRMQIISAAGKSDGAKQIKIADKISNVSDVTELQIWSTETKLQYVRWSCQVVDEMRGVNSALEYLFDQTCEKTLATLTQDALEHL